MPAYRLCESDWPIWFSRNARSVTGTGPLLEAFSRNELLCTCTPEHTLCLSCVFRCRAFLVHLSSNPSQCQVNASAMRTGLSLSSSCGMSPATWHRDAAMSQQKVLSLQSPVVFHLVCQAAPLITSKGIHYVWEETALSLCEA